MKKLSYYIGNISGPRDGTPENEKMQGGHLQITQSRGGDAS